jgi:transcriptional regulator with XRE-family HTH domain
MFYNIFMPKLSKLNLPPLNLGQETIGQRISRLRKEKGLSQVELAQKIGLIQALVSEYERDKIRPHYEMVIRFALALEISADELLGLTPPKKAVSKPSLKILRRLKKIENLPPSQQTTILRNIDMFLKGAEK